MTAPSENSSDGECPTDHILRQSLAGTLDSRQADIIARHLESCDRCGERVVRELDVADEIVPGTTNEFSDSPELAGLMDRLRTFPLLSGQRRPVPNGNENLNLDGSEANPTAIAAEFHELFDKPQATDEIGRLGEYRVLRVVGRGGMGVVFEAEDASQRRVALKLMRPELATDGQVRARFLSEARSMAAIRHENIVQILHIGEVNQVPCLAMEFLNGESLAQRMRQGPALTLDEVVHAGTGIARGLAAAHARGLVHRDVKPDNVHLVPSSDRLLTHGRRGSEASVTVPHFEIRLLDFGLASSTRELHSDDQRQTVIGTPAFMSPEQARGDAVDERSDLFGLGCILYRLVTGRLPYDGGTPVKSLAARKSQTPPTVQSQAPGIPEGLARLINGLLAPDPERRPASAQGVADLLEQMQRRPGFLESHRVGVAVFSCAMLAAASVFAFPYFLSSNSESGSSSVAAVANSLAGTVVGASDPSQNGGETALSDDSSATATVGQTDDASFGLAVAASANPQPAGFPPLESEWFSRVTQLAAEERAAEVIAELQRRNPEFDGAHELKATAVSVQELWLRSRFIADLTPVKALPELGLLFCIGTPDDTSLITDLSPLSGMNLRYLDLGYSTIGDLSPLSGLPLRNVKLVGAQVSSIEPLRGMSLVELQLGGSQISDISAVEDMPLQILSVWGSPVSDLSPLSECATLDWLEIQDTQVRDLSPLRGTPLRRLDCSRLNVDDWSVLADLPLEELHISYDPSVHRDLLLGIPSLKKINYTPADELLEREP